MNDKTLKELLTERFISLDVYGNNTQIKYLVNVVLKLINEHKNSMGRAERNKAFVKETFDLVNLSGNWDGLAEVFIEQICIEHRTLLQSFFRMIHSVIEGYAQHTNSDARNEGSLEWAKKVAIIDGYFPHI